MKDYEIYIGIVILSHIACGYVPYFINSDKGYKHGFWWGLLLGVFGVIAVMARPYEIDFFIERMKEINNQSDSTPSYIDIPNNNSETIKISQELLKYKEMYQNNKISKEEYEKYLNKTINNLKS